jgi:alginate O-acetyltransferase complex protein AlgI
MLGVEIPRNFDAPLRAKSIIEFWQRWHITLSNFITTYLYTPILKSFKRATLFKASLATFLAMTIAGLWHGPSWNFILFGVLHAIGLVTNQYWRKKKMPKLPAFLSWLVTFLLVNFACIYFRSHTIHEGNQMALSLINWHHPLRVDVLLAGRDYFTGRLVMGVALGVVLAFYGKSSDQLAREFEPNCSNSFAVAAMMVVCWLSLTFNTNQSFVYFKF